MSDGPQSSLDVRARTIKGLGWLPFIHHAYIVHTDPDGSQQILEGEPNWNLSIPGIFGTIKSQLSNNARSNDPVSFPIAEGDEADRIFANMQNEAAKIQGANKNYYWWGDNSNTFVRTLVHNCVPPGNPNYNSKPNVWVPGWDRPVLTEPIDAKNSYNSDIIPLPDLQDQTDAGESDLSDDSDSDSNSTDNIPADWGDSIGVNPYNLDDPDQSLIWDANTDDDTSAPNSIDVDPFDDQNGGNDDIVSPSSLPTNLGLLDGNPNWDGSAPSNADGGDSGSDFNVQISDATPTGNDSDDGDGSSMQDDSNESDDSSGSGDDGS